MRFKKLGLLYKGIIVLACGFMLLIVALLGRELIGGDVVEREAVLPFFDEAKLGELKLLTQKDWSGTTDCLFLYDEFPDRLSNREVILPMLEQMRVTCKDMLVSEFDADELEGCSSVIICAFDLRPLGAHLADLMGWVKAGGNVMFLTIPEDNNYFEMIARDLGISGTSGAYTLVPGVYCPRPFMIGGERGYGVYDAYDASVSLELDEKNEVYLESTAEDHTPLIWRRQLGDGTVVVVNVDYIEKAYWGLYASAYSLMGDWFAWPVINGSAFFLDDFPSPVPFGDSQYITRDYGFSVRDFYMRKWWPDVKALGEKYNVRYTGAVIEDYSNAVKAPFDQNFSTNTFHFYGLDLLKLGGEIGLHGYNHMPLVLDGFDYKNQFDAYLPWNSEKDIEAGLSELIRFCTELYPSDKLQIYVPPSNILSQEGRKLIREKFPQIKVIASVYLPDEDRISYAQNFEVADDGVVEVPRIIDGYLMNEFIYFSAFSELNFHYVNTHFQHPDDVMDEERGAELGWEVLRSRLDDYMDWLFDTAPAIRSMTASELGAAVQRYDALTVRRTREDDKLVLELGNFVDEAWLMVRLNGLEPGEVEGGTLEKQLDGLYLLKAESDRVTISVK